MTRSPEISTEEANFQAGRPQAFEPGLYLVSTPIGNLRDMTLRGLDALRAADCVLAEDTRVTGRLLQAYGVEARLLAYHDHNAAQLRPEILSRLDAGEMLALVSDAGTPMVSDPGFKLVREAVDAGHHVSVLPGASALLAALCVSGVPTDRFTFAGFPPPKTQARKRWLEGLQHHSGSLVVYEGASRLTDCLTTMVEILGDRPAAVCRELTKLHEEARRGPLKALAEHYAEAGSPKGEVVIVIGPAPDDIWDDNRVDAALIAALETHSVKDAAAEVAGQSGRAKREVYARALSLRDGA